MALVNRLAASASPYLRQHASDPVAWQPWDDAALSAARQQDRPIFLSIGYAACHWCHVMARESFADGATAELMNSAFVCIKVDREERPDLDRLFLGAVARLGRPAGWPLTVFLTPATEPYRGGGYYPREPAFGLPAFKQVLQDALAQFRAGPAVAAERGKQALQAATAPSRASGTVVISHALLNRVAHDLARSVDWLYGGFGADPPKFLHAGGHEILLHAFLRTGEAGLLSAATHSLGAICRGAVYDHVGGGFHRYAADDRWRVPHFEKMLCDNALMIGVLVKGWQASAEGAFAAAVAQTVAWLLRELKQPDGSFAASLSAEAGGSDVEGSAYTWRPGEIRQVLGADLFGRFSQLYAESDEGPFAGSSVIYRQDEGPGEARDALDALLQARATRPPPFRDGKVLADWNGLAVAALAEAGLAWGRADWIAAAQTAFSAVVQRLGSGSALLHSALDDVAGPPGFLEDYAGLAQAALVLHEVTGDAAYAVQAQAWVQRLDAAFWDDVHGGYFLTEADAGSPAARQNLIDETVAPAGNGTMLAVLAKLASLTGEDRYRDRAARIIHRFGDRMTRASVAAATALNNGDLAGLVQIVVVGHAGGCDTAAMMRAVGCSLLPARLLVLADPAAAWPQGHPARDKTTIDGSATAYVCAGTTCFAPVTSPDQLQTLLRQVVQSAEA